MRQQNYIWMVVILGSMLLSTLTARALSSADYQINDFSEVPIGGTAASADYSVIISPWDQNIIIPVTVPVPAPAPGGGGVPLPTQGGGRNETGGAGATENPTITTVFPHATYGSTLLVEGTRPLNTTIYVNDSSAGVYYPSQDTWAVSRVVGYGENLFEVYAVYSDGRKSLTVSTIGFRRLIGDGNGDGTVDDYDLALLAHQWMTTQWESDFNMDGIVDDFDLAGMAAHWGETMVYPRVGM